MRAKEFTVSLDEKLDEILTRLCELVIDGQKSNQDLGMVAAAVLDPDDNCVTGINYPSKDGRVHAERAAINNYIDRFGPVPPGSIVITTLSPCNQDMDERAGESCQDLLDQHGIDSVYCGYVDPTQDKHQVGLTANKKIQVLCKAFADTFLKDKLDESMFDQCYSQAQKLYNQAESKGLNPVLVQVADYQGDPTNADARWNKIPPRLWQHYVTVVGDTVYDPTATQFGQLPTKYSVDELKQNWAKQYQIQPKELNELEFLGSPCTKDCSGHRAGYAWSQSKGGRVAQSPFSPSFNNGSQLYVDGK